MATGPLKTVLYVDDEADIREIVQMALGVDRSLSVYSSESGEQALAFMRRIKPDLVLLDVMMSGMDGIATFRRMRDDPEYAHIPVIFMTAKTMAQEVAHFRSLGALGVIGKPFNPLKLREQVLSLWGEDPAETAPPEPLRVTNRIEELGTQFLRRTAAEIESMNRLLTQAAQGESAAFRQLERLAHSIRGTGAALGFAAISEQALEVERLAESAADSPPRSPAQLDGAIRQLAEVVSRGGRTAAAG